MGICDGIFCVKPVSSSPLKITISTFFNPSSNVSRIGPAGNKRPFPIPNFPSKTAIFRFFSKVGFCRPSSITTQSSSLSDEIKAAPAGLLRLTQTVFEFDIIKGSSPTSTD